MYDRILKRMREKIRTRQYIMSIHAEEEMDDEELSIFDVERCILSGKIVERQKDFETGEWKYLIQGRSIEGLEMIVVTKLSVTNKLVFITVYLT